MSSVYSWSRFAGRTLAAAAGHQGPPTKLIFVVTKRCYSRCVYCDIWKVKDSPGAMDAELSLEEIRAFARANPFLQWVDFTGGEPTDRPDFVEVIESFAVACPDLLLVHFPTNGIATARIGETVARLHRSVSARLVVTVSIDGPPELNDRLRGIRNDFVHAIETFATVRAQIGAENAFVGMTLHAHKASCGRTAAELVGDTFAAINAALAQRQESPIDWADFHLNIPHLSQHYYGNQASEAKNGFGGPAHRAEVAAALEFADGRSRTGTALAMRMVERVYRIEAQRYLARGRTGITCSALLSTAYLSEEGEVYPCTIWDKPLGNIRRTGYALLPIIEEARKTGVRRAISRQKCPNCWTPCEAHPAILASPLRSALTLAGFR